MHGLCSIGTRPPERVDGGDGLGRGNITTSPGYPYNAMPEVFSAKSVAMHQHPRASAFDNERASLHGWQDRVRDPSLTVLLVLQVFLLFVALPLAAVGVPIAELVAWLVLLVALTFVVVLSRRGRRDRDHPAGVSGRGSERPLPRRPFLLRLCSRRAMVIGYRERAVTTAVSYSRSRP